jgi:hypothetical protein
MGLTAQVSVDPYDNRRVNVVKRGILSIVFVDAKSAYLYTLAEAVHWL